MTTPDLTLNEVRKTAQSITHVRRVSDFLSKEQKNQIKMARDAKSFRKRRNFDDIDAYSAEILARFGYEAWMAWQNGQIKPEKMLKFVLAERARQKRELLGLESIILAVGAGANRPTKNGHAPKSLKNAVKILKNEQNQAKGVNNG